MSEFKRRFSLEKRKEEREQRGAERRAQLKNINNASSSSSSLSSSSSMLSVTDTDTDEPLFIGLFDDDNNS